MNQTKISRRALLGGLGATTVAVTLTACGGGSGTGTSTNGGTGGGSGTAGGVLVIGTGVAASNQFPANFNRYGGGDTAPGLDMVYETLFRLSSKNGGQLIPVLAEKVEHNDEGTVANCQRYNRKFHHLHTSGQFLHHDHRHID